MARLKWFSAAFVLGSLATPAAALTESDVKSFADNFAGSFDSTAQYNMETEAGLSEQERHPRTQLRHVPVVAPGLGRHVLYVEEYALGAAPRLARQRLVTFDLDSGGQVIRMRQYRLRDEASALAEPQTVAKLTRDQVAPLDGCDILFRQDGEVFEGAAEEKACLSPTPEGEAKTYTRLRVAVTPAQIMRTERVLSLDTGRAADGRRDDTPTVFFRQ